MNKSDQISMILNEPIRKVVYKLSLPSILGMLLVGLNSFVDAIFIGKLIGKEALIGASVALPLTQIQFGIGVMVGSGVSSLLSIAIGASDLQTQQKIWGTMIWLIVLLSGITTLLTTSFSSSLLSLIGVSGPSLAEGIHYYNRYALGTVFIVFGLAGNMLIRGEGRLKESMIFAGLSFLINIALNPLFIRVCHMGVAGSATATLVANLFLCLTTIYYYSSHKSTVIKSIKGLSCDFSLLLAIVRTGFSGFVLSIISVLQGLILYFYLGKYGTSRDVLVYGVTNRAATLTIMPAIGLMRALQPAIGINFGARKFERLRPLFKQFTLTGVIILGGMAFVLLVFKDMVFRLTVENFGLSSGEIIRYIILVLPLLVITFFFTGTSFFQAIGLGNTATLIVLLRQLFLFIPILLLLSRYYGITGVFAAVSITDILVSLTCLVLVSMKIQSFLKTAPLRPL